jgi:phosphatidylglycerophosphatase C
VSDPEESSATDDASRRGASVPDSAVASTDVQVAAFDFDGTLTKGGSVWRFLLAMVGARRLSIASCVTAPRLALGALLGGDTASEAKELLFRRTLNGLRLSEIGPLASAFGVAHYRSRERHEVRDRLEWHRREGHYLVIVSASPDLYVRAVGEYLAVHEVIATRLEVDADGLLTGNYSGENCRGKQKLLRTREWMETSLEPALAAAKARARPRAPGRPTQPFLWAYGNSAGDEPLLAGADEGVDVGRLGRFGRLRRFERLEEVVARPTG